MPLYGLDKAEHFELPGGLMLYRGVRETGVSEVTTYTIAAVAAGQLKVIDPDAEPPPVQPHYAPLYVEQGDDTPDVIYANEGGGTLTPVLVPTSEAVDEVALRATTPELVEVRFWHPLSIPVMGATEYLIPFGPVLFPCRVRAASIAHLGGALTLSLSNYYSFRLRRFRPKRAGGVTTVAATELITTDSGAWRCRSSRVDNEVIVIDGRLDPDALLYPRDLLMLRITSAGTPTPMTGLSGAVLLERLP